MRNRTLIAAALALGCNKPPPERSEAPAAPRASLSAAPSAPQPSVRPAKLPAAKPAQPPEPEEEEEAEPDGGKWKEDGDVSVMDGLVTGFAALEAEEPLPGFGGALKPTLMIRCTPKRELDVFVATNAIVRGHYETEVQYRLDSSPPITQEWTRSEDHRMIFAPKPRAMYDQIAKSERLLVRYQPIFGPSRIATFDVRGLSARSGQIKHCLKRR